MSCDIDRKSFVIAEALQACSFTIYTPLYKGALKYYTLSLIQVAFPFENRTEYPSLSSALTNSSLVVPNVSTNQTSLNTISPTIALPQPIAFATKPFAIHTGLGLFHLLKLLRSDNTPIKYLEAPKSRNHLTLIRTAIIVVPILITIQYYLYSYKTNEY